MKNIHASPRFLSRPLANLLIHLEASLSKAKLNFKTGHSPCVFVEGYFSGAS